MFYRAGADFPTVSQFHSIFMVPKIKKIMNKIRIVLRCEIQYMNIDIAKSGGKDEKVVKRSKGDRVNLFTK